MFVKPLGFIAIEPSQGSSSGRVYPLEIYVGGNFSNMGVETLNQSQVQSTGIITLFFEKQDDQAKWLKFLEKATGSFKIKDFYFFNDITDKKYSFAMFNFDRIKDLKLKYQSMEGSEKDLDQIRITQPELHQMFPFERFDDVLGIGASGSIIVQGSHKHSKKQVAIKVYQKKNLSNHQVEEIREIISIYQCA